MTLYQFLMILRSRYRLVILIILGSISLTFLVTVFIPKQYTAQTSVLIDVRSPDPVSGGAMQGQVTSSYIATQVDIISGDRVAKRVIKMLKLNEDQNIKNDWLNNTQGRGKIDDWLAQSLKKNLDVRPSRESNVINIIYKGTSPDSVSNIVNSFSQAYLDINLALKTEPARLYAEWFDEQTKLSRAKLETAQARLSNFQQKAGIITSDERVDYEVAKLGQISTQLTTVQGETTDSQSKRNSRGDTVAEVMQSPLINGLKADVARLEAKVQESGINLGANHPQQQRSESELASLKSRLASETRRITASIETTYRVSKDRERELQGAVSAQRARVLQLNKQRDELNVYRRDVESAQRAYEAVSQSASQTRLQSLTNQTNVVLLTSAVPPLNASSPKLLINLLIAALASTLFGVACAVLLELTNRRVRSSDDLVQMLDLPVLASISSGTRYPRVSDSRQLMLGNGSSV